MKLRTDAGVQTDPTSTRETCTAIVAQMDTPPYKNTAVQTDATDSDTVAIQTDTIVCSVAATQTDETLVYDSFSQTDSTGASKTLVCDSFSQTDSTTANETVTTVVRDASIATARPSADINVVGTQVTDCVAVQTESSVRCTSAVTDETESVSSIESVDSASDNTTSAKSADDTPAAIPIDTKPTAVERNVSPVRETVGTQTEPFICDLKTASALHSTTSGIRNAWNNRIYHFQL